MLGKIFKRFLFASLLILAFSLTSHAGPLAPMFACTGSSPSWSATGDSASIQDCINRISPGDVITITSSGSLDTVITASNKNFTLKGSTCTTDALLRASSCPIVLTGNTGTASPLQIETCSASNFAILQDFELQVQSTGSSSGMVYIYCNNAEGAPEVSFRIIRMIFDGDSQDGSTNNTNGPRWFKADAVYGVISRSRFLATTSRGMGNVACGTDNSISTSYNYHHPFSLGDTNALYIENSYFYSAIANQGNGATDNYVCRIVGRFLEIWNNNVGLHGFDSQRRGVMTFEFLKSDFTAINGIGSIPLFQPRSGTGVFLDNDVLNQGSGGYATGVTPVYYGAMNAKDLGTNGAWYKQRPTAQYPNGSWSSYPGSTTSYLNADGNNLVTGQNPLDGTLSTPSDDSFGVKYHFESSRTCTITTNGTTTITSADCAFVALDVEKSIISASFKRRYAITGCSSTGGTTITCPSATFVASDVGLQWARDDRVDIGAGENGTIASVAPGGDTTKFVSSSSTAAGTFVIIFNDPYITAVAGDGLSATMSVAAIDSGSGKSIEIGYLDTSYPLLDQPGFGPFAVSNNGNWPNVTTGYSAANYEERIPIAIGNNTWNGGAFPATAANYPSTRGYLKNGREWQDQVVAASFDGSLGTGYGVLADRPVKCTAGVYYWATDQGSWNLSGAGGQGILYKCTGDAWTTFYTPYTYPYPGTSSNVLTFTAQPASIHTGATFSSFTVASQIAGVTDTTFVNDVTLTISSCGATLGGTVTVTPVSGVATFNAVTATGNGINCTLTASASNADNGTSNSFNVGPNQLGITVQPSASYTSGTTFNITVAGQYSNGTTDTSANNSVTISLNAVTGSGALSGSVTQSLSSGVRAFSLTISGAGTFTITASASGLTSAVSNGFSVSGDSLAFTTQPPASISSGQSMSVAVTVRYPNATTDTSVTNAVTLSIASGSCIISAPLVNPSSGIATFTNVVVVSGSGSCVLTASALNVTSGNSDAFTVSGTPPPVTSAGRPRWRIRIR